MGLCEGTLSSWICPKLLMQQARMLLRCLVWMLKLWNNPTLMSLRFAVLRQTQFRSQDRRDHWTTGPQVMPKRLVVNLSWRSFIRMDTRLTSQSFRSWWVFEFITSCLVSFVELSPMSICTGFNSKPGGGGYGADFVLQSLSCGFHKVLEGGNYIPRTPQVGAGWQGCGNPGGEFRGNHPD